jgi:two-component system, chemotaxis family, CheB/CheR fusion protein
MPTEDGPKHTARPHGSPPEEGGPPPDVARFPIVGIGASAGGLQALEALISRLHDDSMAYVIVQHLAPDHVSLLVDILSRSTSMRLVTAEDRAVIESNTIYVAPPNADVLIEGGALRLVTAAERVPPHAIDRFFRSLAAEMGSAAIGVILSGAGSDGTLGLRAISEAGGITFVQDPSTAGQSSMPQSALSDGCADFCMAPSEIGDELMRTGAHPYVARKRAAKHFDPQSLGRFFEQLKEAFGVDFASYKLSTIERRIERRMALQKLDRPQDYLRLLQSNPHELGVLYGDLLIGVTSFFRDREPFEALKTVVFPRLLGDRPGDASVRIWVPGCAAGQEAFSIAMCLLEYLDGKASAQNVQIFGTDIDDQALAIARRGLYPSGIGIDVSPERLQRFFTIEDDGYRVARQLRDMVVFAHHDLGHDPPFSRLDLVSCRNVLIYLQPGLQRKILRVFHYALNTDAFLLLGTSESAGEASDLFSLVDRKLKIYSKKSAASSAVFNFVAGAGATDRSWQQNAPRGTLKPRSSDVQALADRKVLERFAPPGVVVDEHMQVLQFRGELRHFLSPSPGTATLNVLKLVRPELMVQLRQTIAAATKSTQPVTSERVWLLGEKPSAAIVIEALPLPRGTERGACVLVLFRELPTAGEGDAEAPPEEHVPPQNAELARELLTTKEYLQATVQELESANEELQGSNEELQSLNEELQSTNEELETSKEELQSTNEELATVNDELQNRIAQLSVSNDDLTNVLTTVSAPLIVVGTDLRIRRFSSAAEGLLNLIPDDVGRPVGYLGAALNAPKLESLVAEAISRVEERGQRLRCSDGHWYSMRVLPYRTADFEIRGAVIEFSRIPPGRRLSEPVEINELVGKVLSTLPNVLMLIDEQVRLVWGNKAFFDTFMVGAEMLGRPLDEVWESGPTHSQLWSALEASVSHGAPFAELRIERPFRREDEAPMLFSAHPFPAEGNRPPLTLVVMARLASGDTE